MVQEPNQLDWIPAPFGDINQSDWWSGVLLGMLPGSTMWGELVGRQFSVAFPYTSGYLFRDF